MSAELRNAAENQKDNDETEDEDEDTDVSEVETDEDVDDEEKVATTDDTTTSTTSTADKESKHNPKPNDIDIPERRIGTTLSTNPGVCKLDPLGCSAGPSERSSPKGPVHLELLGIRKQTG